MEIITYVITLITLIGTVGNSGNVSTPQLYFSLRNGREAVDPIKYLKNE